MSRSKDIETPEGKIRHEAKFHRILDAALDIFVQKGFHHAKISEVARAAGVADGTIYLYFKNKEDLMASLFDVKLEALATRLRDETKWLIGSQTKLAYVVDFHLQLAQEQASLMSFMRHEVHVGYLPWGKRERADKNPYLAEWVRIIEEGVANGSLQTDVDATALMQMLFGALDHACNVWASQPQAQDALAQTRAHIRQFILEPLSAKS